MVLNELLKIIMWQGKSQLSDWFFLVPNLAMETVKNRVFFVSKVWPEYNKLHTRSGRSLQSKLPVKIFSFFSRDKPTKKCGRRMNFPSKSISWHRANQQS